MKINNKLLSIPPYLSTAWSNVAAVYMRDNTVIVNLLDGDSIEIPNLSGATIETIFSTHASVVEQEAGFSHTPLSHKLSHPLTQALMQAGFDNMIDSPLRLSFGSIDELGSILQHNPQQAGAPDLPKEVLEKIAAITKIISPEEGQLMPKPEAHCNCFHCQISRAILGEEGALLDAKQLSFKEEVVNDEELKFQQWEIIPNGANLFQVTNRLDDKEKYSVYLGSPLGCTCGHEGCEHIIAVLKS